MAIDLGREVSIMWRRMLYRAAASFLRNRELVALVAREIQLAGLDKGAVLEICRDVLHAAASVLEGLGQGKRKRGPGG